MVYCGVNVSNKKCFIKYLSFDSMINVNWYKYTGLSVKIGRLKFVYWKFPVIFFSFRSKFVLQKIPYFRFVSPKDRYFHITEHFTLPSTSLSSKKKSLPTSKIVGQVRGNRNIFNCGLTTSKLEWEVTSFSESSQGEMEDNREKFGDFWGKLMVINRNIVLRPLWSYPAQI